MDTTAVSEALGVFPIIQGDKATYYLVGNHTGVQLRLELKPTIGWLRLHADLKSSGRHIARVTIECVEHTQADPVRGFAAFSDERTTLTIWPSGTFSVDVQ